MRLLTSILLFVPALLTAQDKGTSLIYPGSNYTEVKQYLGLTDAQMQSLQSILDNRSQAMQNVYEQLRQKNETMYQLLKSGSGSPAQLGQLLIDIHNLEKQVPLNDGPYRAQALAVLNADQKVKLTKLSEALQLQNTASQAGMLLLVEYPMYIGPPVMRGGPTPASTPAN